MIDLSEVLGDSLELVSHGLSEPNGNSSWANDTVLDGGNGTTGGGYAFAALPWWRQVLWSVLFGSMVIVATVGNLVVVWIVLAHKRMRTVTNYLLVNLSIADAMVSTINVIPNYIYMSTQHWPFGALYCKVVQFVAVLSICASVFSLMAIAFDRYTAIMNPLKPRMGRKVTLGIAAGIWVGGSILSCPQMIFFTTYEHANHVVVCYSEWPDGAMTDSFHEYMYNLMFMLFTYFVPIIVMGYTYARVGIELWGSQSIGEATQRQLENIKSKRRVVKMMIVVVTIFAFCWLPFHLYFIVVSMWPEVTKHSHVQEIYLGIYWLAMSNSIYNPIIYCWMNARFRRGFQQVFFWCPFVHYNRTEGGTSRTIADMRRGDPVTRYSVTGSPEIHTRIQRNGRDSTTVHIPLHVLTSGQQQGKGGPEGKDGGCHETNGDGCQQRTTTTSNSSTSNSSSGKENHHLLSLPSSARPQLCINKSHVHHNKNRNYSQPNWSPLITSN